MGQVEGIGNEREEDGGGGVGCAGNKRRRKRRIKRTIGDGDGQRNGGKEGEREREKRREERRGGDQALLSLFFFFLFQFSMLSSSSHHLDSQARPGTTERRCKMDRCGQDHSEGLAWVLGLVLSWDHTSSVQERSEL